MASPRACAVAFGLLSLACTRRVINDSHSGTPRELGSHPEAGATPVGSHSAATPSPDAGPASKSKLLPPLQAAEPTLALEVPGFRTAVVSVPTGAREPRPVWVALHGNFDRPEWQCGVWREVTGAFPFILCPRGSPRTDAPKSLDRWTYLGVAQTEKELEAGLEALRSRFTGYVSDGTVVFLGFSLGAI
ncbi:MAG TPA: hypothetical protein VGJ84_23120, partial [Polyangiaceae bacterium]